MFKHILIPLDGSRLAEAVLPASTMLARGTGARVTLVHVLERNAPARVHGDRHLTAVPEAAAYLEEIAARLTDSDGLTVDVHVHNVAEANVTASIAGHAAELRADLVVLATHGSGFREAVFGSIAQQVIGTGETPVLIIHPEAAPMAPALRKLAVPLDGEAGHDTSLPVAEALAAQFGAALELVTVVPRRVDLGWAGGAVGRMLPSAMEALLDVQAEEQARRLAELVQRLRSAGLEAKARLERGDPCGQILSALRESDADMAVLATHTKHGIAAFWNGSVAPKVLAQWKRPVLLIRAK
jgi:nucleotide-binding universal stress UspA family protein